MPIKECTIELDSYKSDEELWKICKENQGKNIYVGGHYVGRIEHTWVYNGKALARFNMELTIK